MPCRLSRERRERKYVTMKMIVSQINNELKIIKHLNISLSYTKMLCIIYSHLHRGAWCSEYMKIKIKNSFHDMTTHNEIIMIKIYKIPSFLFYHDAKQQYPSKK